MESGVPNGARIELLSAYNSLSDKHLTGYFNNTRIRRHLQRVGLISRSGRIVPDKEYRHKLIQRAHQRHVRECLAQAIFHKVLEMERVHQIEIKRKLEEFTRRERVHKIKLDRSKRYEEDVIRILSPRPPTGPRSGRRQHSGPEGEHTESSESPGSSRPNTAPGKMQRPVRLKPIHSNSTTASRRRGSPYRRHDSSNETDHTLSYTMDKDSQRHRTATDFSRGITPYCLPVINNFVTPVPPPTKRKERGLRASGTLRGRRLRPTTAPLAPDITEESPMLRSSALQSGVCVNMVFFGKTVHLSHDLIDLRDEVKVFQQHCGGENLCVYKGKLREGDTFQFVSRRHRGFPFSLTFFLNGLQVERLSSCCEFKHKKGSRLGGRHGHFGFISVEGASPCYKCIIAMGLDKKPTPPPKRIKEDREAPSPEEPAQHRRTSPEDPTQHRRTSPEEPTQHRRTSPEEPTQHTPEMEKESESTPKDPAAHTEPELSQPQEMETKIEEDIQPEEDKPRDDYEEDFEADDEGPAEDGEVKEEKISPARERDASDSEEDKKEGDRRSRSASSSSGSDREDSETGADNKGAQTAEQPKEPEGDAPKVYQEETPVPPAEEKEQPPAASDTRAAEKDSPVPPLTTGSPRAKESGSDGSPGESTELEVSDTSAPLGNGGKVDNDTSGDVEQGKEADKLIDEHTEEQEPERAKSVQEKVAEAILKEAQCSSEPELSDTTTEEEEDSTEKRQQQDNNDAVPEIVVNCEASPVTAESAEDQREANSELKEEDKSTPEPQDNEHGVNSEMEKTEDTEMAEPAEDNKQDTTQDSEHGVNVELEIMQDTGTAVPDEDNKENTEEKESSEKSHNEAKPTDTEVDEEKKQEEEKVTAEADPEPTETQCTKEDESPPSEPENKVAAIETAEMKPEPQEDLTCEETPVADAEKQGDGEAVPGGPSEGSGDTATIQAEKTADTTEVKAEDEVITEDETEQAPEEALGAEANNEDLQQESVKESEKAEEESDKSIKENVEDDKVEREKSDDNEVGGKETNQDETAEGDKGEVKEQTGEVNSEQEDKHENKEEERIKVEEDNGNTEEKAKEEPEVGNSDEGDKVTDEAKVEEVETSERNDEGSKVQGSEDIKDKIDPENAEEKVTTADTVVEVEGSSHGTAEQLENNAEGVLEKGNKSANMTDDNVGDHKVDDEEQETENTEDKPEESNMEADSVQKEHENERAHSEKDERETTAVEVDTENGERDSMKASESQEDGAKTTSQEKHDVDGENTEEKNTSSETTKEEPDKVEPEQGSEDHEETSDNCNDDKADQVAETNLENESKIEDTNADVKSESQSEEPNKDKDMEESKQHPDENTEVTDCKESAPEDEDMGSDMNEKNNNTLNNVNEVILVTSEPHSSQPAAVDLDNMTHKSDEEKEKSSAPSDSKIEKHTNSEANATDDAPSAVDGDTGADTEEASKPSEEGASVVLKPQAESAQLTDKGADQPKESALGKEGDVPEQTAKTEENNATPEFLEIEDSRNLVTNWVTLHQTTKSFQKFSDPIEVESTNTTVLQKSASPVQMLTMDEHKVGDEINAESVEKEPQPTENDGSESKDNTKVEDLHSDLKSNHSKDDAPSESQPTEDAPQVKEESGVTQQAPITETDNDEEDTTMPANKEMSTEEHNDKSGLFEGEKHQEPAANDGSEPKDNTKVEDLHSDLKSNHSKDDAPSESQPTEDALQVKEETGVTEPVPITESENDGEDATRGANKEMCTEEHKETSELFEGGKDQVATTQKDTEQSDNCKTEMESITNQTEASVKSDRGPENQREEEITQDDPGLNSKQTMIEEITNVPSPPISEGHQESSESPEKLDPSGITTTGEPENTENGDKKEEDSTELTEVSDLTLTSKSEEGSQDDSHTGQTQTQTKQTEGSINGDNKTVQLIEDKKDLNKDPLSVKDTSLLGHNTYALLTTARTEND